MINILYDISVLGLGHESNTNRAGIYRVIEDVAKELAISPEVHLEFCASEFNNYYTHDTCLSYLDSSDHFKHVPFYYPPHQETYCRLLNKLRRRLLQRAEINKDNFFLKLSCKGTYKLTTYLSLVGNQLIQPIPPSSLDKAELYHSTVFKIPEQVRCHRRIRKFLTVYDLIPVLYPDFFDVKSKHDHFVKKALDSLTADDWAVCISESTKNDLCEYKKFDPNRVFVIPLAANDKLFYPCKDPDKKKLVFEKYNIPNSPYFLGLSTLEPRKNIGHTIRCFLEMVEQEKINDLNLVLVGDKGWKYGEIFQVLEEHKQMSSRVIFTGYVDDNDLAVIYSNALAFVYMSFYEGFGLPPLEAMNCGIPVITSNTSSLPEVVGDAGILLPPSSKEALSTQLLAMYNDGNLRSKLSSQSLERSKFFSWQKASQNLINGYQIALSS